MKGLELAEKFYIEYGEPMLKTDFPHLLPKIAVGLAGSGSECFGYDDGLSSDHDFEPGFCIFLPSEDEVDRREAFLLERAYAKLPREFMGYERARLSPVGGNRRGVIRMSEFFEAKTGSPDGELTLHAWLTLPEEALAEAVNGKVFFDGLGQVTEIRERLSYLPQDVRLKKLAGELVIMGQAGQYNYPRCIKRGDTAAAQMSVAEFVNSALHVIFLLNGKYMPYYKWTFRALSELPVMSELYPELEYLISSGNGTPDARKKQEIIEKICENIADKLRADGLSNFVGNEAEGHAYAVNNKIDDGEIRNLHVLAAR